MAYPAPKPKMSQPVSVTPSMPPKPKAPSQSGGALRGLVTLVVVIIIIAGGVYLLNNFAGLNIGQNSVKAQFVNEWQAVFLTNGQVYFGKIKDVDSDNVYLKDIYYLQVVNQPLQRSQNPEGEVPLEDGQTEQRLTLIKLGNELHGPRDVMVINRDHVILLEDLKDDARVVQAINDYKANNQ